MTEKKLHTILYAEDETDIRQIAQIALEDIGGFAVTFCSNGREAVEKAAKQQADLILLDIMMPIMDGPSTLKELRKLPDYKNTPVIFMTARVQPEEITEYKNLGAIAIINKPFDPMTLVDEILNAWRKS